MSLSKEIIEFLDMPDTLRKILKENRNVMSKVQELQSAFEEMKQTLADEATELWNKFDELQAQIDAKVDPSSLEPIIADIRGSISNVEALSEGRPVAPAPTEDTTGGEMGGGETAPVEEAPETGGDMGGGMTEPAPVEEPVTGGETMPTEGGDTGMGGETAPVEGGEVAPTEGETAVPVDSGASTGTTEGSETTGGDTAGAEEVGGSGSEEEPSF